MGKHLKDGICINRNKTLDNLCMIFTNLSVGVHCPTNEDRIKVRKILLDQIQTWLKCNRRTAYDYIQAVEQIMENLPQASRDAIIGGKKEHTTYDD